MSTEPIDLDALRALEAEATRGPWTATDHYPHVVFQGGDDMVSTNLAGNPLADGQFIAAARNAMPALLAELARYHTLHDWLAAEVEAKNWVAYDEIAEQLAKVNEVTTRRPVPVMVEWAAEVRYLSGEVRYDAAAGVLAASVTAHGINEHVASLNEPTREFNGVEGARVVSREVRDLPDGSRLIGPWKPVESAAEVS